MNKYVCNNCGYSWYQETASNCIKCRSANILIEREEGDMMD